jgi:hypothetical protein
MDLPVSVVLPDALLPIIRPIENLLPGLLSCSLVRRARTRHRRSPAAREPQSGGGDLANSPKRTERKWQLAHVKDPVRVLCSLRVKPLFASRCTPKALVACAGGWEVGIIRDEVQDEHLPLRAGIMRHRPLRSADMR